MNLSRDQMAIFFILEASFATDFFICHIFLISSSFATDIYLYVTNFAGPI